MEKFISSHDYLLFLSLLRGTRRTAELTQEQVAACLGQTQSFVSKCERGERRIDVIELRAFCQAIGISLDDFIQQLEDVLRQGKS
jgi:transcriptional regulator with XRE-family HTH domain